MLAMFNPLLLRLRVLRVPAASSRFDHGFLLQPNDYPTFVRHPGGHGRGRRGGGGGGGGGFRDNRMAREEGTGWGRGESREQKAQMAKPGGT
eukprot:761785-Hanusia_phi.AAC.2